MNSINNIYQYNSKKVFKILIALFILLFVSYISIFKGIADINLKRVLVTIFKNLSFRKYCWFFISNLWSCNASNYRK